MTNAKFMELMEELFERPAGSLRGDESLDELDWDSLKALSFIVVVDEHLGLADLSPVELSDCRTLKELRQLVAAKIEG